MKQMTLLYLQSNDKILLAMKKRGFGQGRWNGVGGKVETNESLEQAVVRECQEEIGVTPLSYEKVAVMDYEEIHEGERKVLEVNVYLCLAWNNEPQETEEMRPVWFLESDIPYQSMWPADKYWLPLILAGKKLRGQFTLDDHDHVAEKTLQEVEAF